MNPIDFVIGIMSHSEMGRKDQLGYRVGASHSSLVLKMFTLHGVPCGQVIIPTIATDALMIRRWQLDL